MLLTEDRAFELPLPFKQPANVNRVKELLRFLRACDSVKERHPAARFHLKLNALRARFGLPEMTWPLFVATMYFAKTFRVDGPKISWRDLV